MTRKIAAPPTAFISYSWDGDDHRAWTRALAERLRADGVDAMLDQWAMAPGDQLPAFMERSIGDSDFVLIVCTPRYKARSEKRIGGAGYEGDIITGELMQHRNHRKFIPLLRRGTEDESLPGWLKGKYFIDLRDGPRFEAQYQDLLATVHGSRLEPPPVRRRETSDGKERPVPAATESPDEYDPVRILGVIADEVSEPALDGTRGSALYRVPFRLSRSVSPSWAEAFVQAWDHPPRFTTMHRPGLASASKDRIVLNGTTIEEVQGYHRDTLILCVGEANKVAAKEEERERREREAKRERSEEHRRIVKKLSDEIRFDD